MDVLRDMRREPERAERRDKAAGVIAFVGAHGGSRPQVGGHGHGGLPFGDPRGHRLRESGMTLPSSGGSTGRLVGRILLERKVSARPVVVRDVARQDAAQVRVRSRTSK